MMTLPSSSQLLSVVRAEIAATLGGLSEDPQVVNCLGMVDSMLASVAVRCEHEIGWMITEIDEAAAFAAELIAAGHDPDSRIAQALTELRAIDRSDFATQSVRVEYHQASALLSECVEISLTVGGDLRARADAVLAARLDHEAQIRGALSLVGRG
jgi:hypothetical protein